MFYCYVNLIKYILWRALSSSLLCKEYYLLFVTNCGSWNPISLLGKVKTKVLESFKTDEILALKMDATKRIGMVDPYYGVLLVRAQFKYELRFCIGGPHI